MGGKEICMKKNILSVISLILASMILFGTSCRNNTGDVLDNSSLDSSSFVEGNPDSSSGDKDSSNTSGGDNKGTLYFPEYEPDDAPVEKIVVNPARVASGNSTSSRIALNKDGKAWAWGSNKYGQLGNGEQTTSSYDATAFTPQEVQTDARFISVSAGEQHVLAIDKDNNLWGWGKFEHPLQDSSLGSITLPIPTQLIPNNKFVFVEAGTNCSFAIDMAGNLLAWGTNHGGELGDGTTLDVTEAKLIFPEKTFSYISSSNTITYAIDTDGKLWGWGTTYNGIGDGTKDTKYLTPVQIMPDRKFVQVSTNGLSTYALEENGSLWGWGSNAKGQLGDGTKEKQLTPVPIMAGKYFTCVDVSVDTTHAIDVQGKLWTWGIDNELLNVKYYPQQMESDVRFLQVSAGLALDENGEIWTWGNNGSGTLGDGSAENIYSPIQVFKDMCFVKINMYNNSTYALDTDGNLWVWGAKGNQTAENSLMQVIKGKKIKDFSASGHILAIDTEGNLWSWGANTEGQLGDGTTKKREEPIQIMPEKKFIKVSADQDYSHAIDSQGNLWAWGGNGDALYGGGQGLGNVSKQLTPEQVQKGTKFVDVRSWNNRGGYAIDTNGKLWGWSELNILDFKGTYHTPVQVVKDRHFSVLPENFGGDMKLNHGIYLLDTKGNIFSWNSFFNEIEANYQTPITVLPNKKFSSIVQGDMCVFALDIEGKICAWGNNTHGQMGIGTKGGTVTISNYKTILPDKTFSYVYAEGNSTFAIDTDGKLWAWGANSNGALDGTVFRRSTPEKIVLK